MGKYKLVKKILIEETENGIYCIDKTELGNYALSKNKTIIKVYPTLHKAKKILYAKFANKN
jgi:hypothetical protein